MICLRAIIAAWLEASQRSQVVVSKKRFERSNGLDNVLDKKTYHYTLLWSMFVLLGSKSVFLFADGYIGALVG